VILTTVVVEVKRSSKRRRNGESGMNAKFNCT